MKKYGNVKWLPNGVNPLLFSYNKFSKEFDNSITFIGAMHYQPNIDAIIWFDRYVLDHIDPTIRFFIIGSNPNIKILNIAKKRKNVIVTGFLEDPYCILNSCSLVVSPMQNGGGIQNKILESMALGKINILTSTCSKPIKGAVDLIHFFVKDNPKEMANLINEVCSNPMKYNQIGINAKELIRNNYTWESHEFKLLKELNSLNRE
jgi:glycosyltransferase involved in cell wall biosynthesis